jgi:hypothetical protein
MTLGDTTRKDEFGDHQEAQVAELLHAVRRIEAPVGFETRVMARIAGGKDATAGRLSAIRIVFRVAVPLVLLIMIGGYLTYYNYRDEQPPIAVAEQTKPPAAEPPRPEPTLEAVAAIPPVQNGKANEERSGSRPQMPRPASNKKPSGENIGGSFDQAASPKSPSMPKGISTAPVFSANRDDAVGSVEVQVLDVLQLIGITADHDGGWKVRSVTPNSLAANSGVKAGDVVTTLDDKPLGADTVFKGENSAKTITIVRGSERLVLPLKPN